MQTTSASFRNSEAMTKLKKHSSSRGVALLRHSLAILAKRNGSQFLGLSHRD